MRRRKLVFVNGSMSKYAKQLVTIEMNGLTLPEKNIALNDDRGSFQPSVTWKKSSVSVEISSLFHSYVKQ